MPSHPDRVRRSYHEIKVNHKQNLVQDEEVITIKVTKAQIATAMSGSEIYHNIVRAIRNGVFARWGK